MNSETWGLPTKVLMVVLFVVGFATGVTLGRASGHLEAQQAAVKAGCAHWEADADGKATFRWGPEEEKAKP